MSHRISVDLGSVACGTDILFPLFLLYLDNLFHHAFHDQEDDFGCLSAFD